MMIWETSLMKLNKVLQLLNQFLSSEWNYLNQKTKTSKVKIKQIKKFNRLKIMKKILNNRKHNKNSLN